MQTLRMGKTAVPEWCIKIEEVKINEKFQASDLDWIDLQLKSMLVKSYSKFPQLFAFFSGFVYDNLKCYLLLMSK